LKMNTVILTVLIITILILFNESIPIFIFNRDGCAYKHVRLRKLFSYENPSWSKFFNPSLLKTDQGYLCCVRNSTVTSKHFAAELYGQFCKNSNIVFMELSNNFKISRIINQPSTIPIEDPRIIQHNHHYYIFCTENTGKSFHPILLIYTKQYQLQQKIAFDYPNNKNWCPFVHDNKLYVHTDSYPRWKVALLTDNKLETVLDIESTFQVPPNLYLRCSTSWKEYDADTYICGLHTKSQDFSKKIRTALVLIDKKTFKPLKYTEFFCIENSHNRVQFLSGLESDSDKILLSYGIGNFRTDIYSISKHKLNQLLHLLF